MSLADRQRDRAYRRHRRLAIEVADLVAQLVGVPTPADERNLLIALADLDDSVLTAVKASLRRRVTSGENPGPCCADQAAPG